MKQQWRINDDIANREVYVSTEWYLSISHLGIRLLIFRQSTVCNSKHDSKESFMTNSDANKRACLFLCPPFGMQFLRQDWCFFSNLTNFLCINPVCRIGIVSSVPLLHLESPLFRCSDCFFPFLAHLHLLCIALQFVSQTLDSRRSWFGFWKICNFFPKAKTIHSVRYLYAKFFPFEGFQLVCLQIGKFISRNVDAECYLEI